MRPRGWSEWTAAVLLGTLVVFGTLSAVWLSRYAVIVHRLTRGVGDTNFYGADGQPWFRLDEQRHDVALSEISVDLPSYLPDEYINSQDAKLDIYRRLTHMTETGEIEALMEEVRDRFGALPEPARVFFAVALLRVLGGASDIESVLVRGNEARITFREHAVPRMKGISAAFHEVQFQAEVRRAHPLSLKLTRLGGAEMLDGLVRALTTLRPT